MVRVQSVRTACLSTGLMKRGHLFEHFTVAVRALGELRFNVCRQRDYAGQLQFQIYRHYYLPFTFQRGEYGELQMWWAPIMLLKGRWDLTWYLNG
jgi:hypothetical protein